MGQVGLSIISGEILLLLHPLGIVSHCSFRLAVTVPAVLIKNLVSTNRLSAAAVFVSVTRGSLFGVLGYLCHSFPWLRVSAVFTEWRLTQPNKWLYHLQFSYVTGAANDENKPYCFLTTFLAYYTMLYSHGSQALAHKMQISRLNWYFDSVGLSRDPGICILNCFKILI